MAFMPLLKAPKDLFKCYQTIRLYAVSGSCKEIPDLLKLLSPLQEVPLLPNADEEGDLSCVLPSLFDQQPKPPAVTTILGGSMDDESAFRLHRWRKKKIKELGEEGFQKLNRETMSYGTSFHSLVHQYLEEENEPDLRGATPKALRLFQSALPELRRVDKYVTGEIFSTNPLLFYRGKIDTLAIVDGQLTLLEWKTSSKQKPTLASTYDAPIQTAAYLGALNRDPNLIIPGFRTLSSNKSQNVLSTPLLPTSKLLLTRAKIVVCYDDASQATVHDLDIDDLNTHWGLWRDRLVTYWLRSMASKNSKVP